MNKMIQSNLRKSRIRVKVAAHTAPFVATTREEYYR
jgi:hypothetical protein